ncbi:MAG: energy-coupling factor transporter ATPase [Clostridia bacterium]|nr:energy-coupling factor transporter ATPase [Clostridia bacterium]
MADNIISVRNLSFSYTEEDNPQKENTVLKNFSIDIERGAFVCILGHNGSGKSTFAKLLNMVLTPTSGQILINGKDITDSEMSDDDIFEVRRNIGMVFQNPDNQLVATIVEEDVAFGPENLGVPPSEIRERVDNALEVVGMTEYARHSPHQLSGGQKQRVAIAGIIAMLPECIIFDESTAMLDPQGRKEVMATINMLNKEKGITILHITHNMDEAVLADRVVVINEGELYLDGTPKQVFSKIDKLNTAGLDVPQVTELFDELNKCGLELPHDVLCEEEGAKLLASVLK